MGLTPDTEYSARFVATTIRSGTSSNIIWVDFKTDSENFIWIVNEDGSLSGPYKLNIVNDDNSDLEIKKEKFNIIYDDIIQPSMEENNTNIINNGKE